MLLLVKNGASQGTINQGIAVGYQIIKRDLKHFVTKPKYKLN